MTATLPDSARAIRADLRRRILHHEWEVGQRLPGERLLATEYAVSRPVIREALASLASDGLVTVSPGRGAFIAEPDGRALTDALTTFVSTARLSVRDIAGVRLVVESAGVAGAAQHATVAQVQRLAELSPMIDTGADRIEQAIADLAFHTLVCQASGNPMLSAMYRAMGPSVLMMMLRAGRCPEQSAAEHRMIVDAIRDGDAERARQLTATHLQETATYFGPDFERPADEVATENLGRISGGLADIDEVTARAMSRLSALTRVGDSMEQ